MQVYKDFTITKSLVRDLNNLNGLHDMTSEIAELQNIPQFLTSMFDLDEEFLNTSTFEHDVTRSQVGMPSDKAFHERGDVYALDKEVDTHLFKVPSFGMQSFVRPEDANSVRVPGTANEAERWEAVVDERIAGMRKGASLFGELRIAKLLTTGENYIPNGSISQTDFYAEYAGLTAATRPYVDYELDQPDTMVSEKGEDARNMILDNLLEGQTVGGFVAVCGKNFFRALFSHPKNLAAMTDRAGIEGQDPLIKRLREYPGAEQYRMFRGADDVVYVQYHATIGGQRLIGDDEAYMFPVNTSGIIKRVYAPARTKTYINSIAQREYMWQQEGEFTGTALFWEQNATEFMQAPLCVIKLLK